MTLGYLGVSLIGYVILGILGRAQLDLIGDKHPNPAGLVLVALYALIVTIGTPIGYTVIRLATADGDETAQNGRD
ncbi:hypothetical protein HQQ81_21270 [Microbacteriaceae bacterium VKM Ac-2854]|nr:hypothetical protein [Microbacteriaceae bacterium VKM Ac-2854]